MDDLPIPPEVVAAMQAAWEDGLPPDEQWAQCMRAGLRAWKGMDHFRNQRNRPVYLETLVKGGVTVLILPLEPRA